MAKQTYSISDLANELDITTRAIRFYEEQGMLTPTRRGQERIYSPKDRVALKLILRGKRIVVLDLALMVAGTRCSRLPAPVMEPSRITFQK